MIIRIVKMNFRENEVQRFITIFSKYNQQIRQAEGCTYLALLREKKDGNIFFTYSKWNEESFLEKYRHSEIFAEVWPQTKALFAAPAEAWTVTEEIILS